MKKIIVLLSAMAMAFSMADAQSLSTWKQQKRFIDAAAKDSVGKIGKRGTISFGGSVNEMNNGSMSEELSGGAWAEFSMAAYKNRYHNFGIDVSVPINYNNFNTDGKDTLLDSTIDYNRLDIPVQIKPYLKYAFSKNLVVAPFVFASVGMSYNDVDMKATDGTSLYKDNSFELMYNFGGGAELQIYKFIALTPKVTYTKVSGMDKVTQDNEFGYGTGVFGGINEGWEISLEHAVQLVKGWTLLAEYAYNFDNEGFAQDDIKAHIVKFGFRFGY
ncbi:MAG: hypothetical protein J6B07_04660 [Opitutales bacterium]|nr:hypothetical protein [Opitutales bacterium]